ncbi:hypothetical protein [Olleya sp. Bg11-27]|uniref:hypothetical protein n=1 Tax=Olleya sp. Bg11-27 TaxID=2058135 RepID=UPI000C31B1F7|nr:hypothetical protein [Olleya sp. Bg11-27]AUC75707.1 hypothetical protein CW732_08485 [Olleya sp. Bg11-27]
MKKIALIILYFSITVAQSQTNFQTLLDDSKKEFNNINSLDREAYDKANFNQVVNLLEKALLIEPNHPEANYFLGYTYSRINAKDGRGITGMDLDLLIKTSAQFEKVNQLSPQYKGEVIVLDPYSKITAEWGSMGLKYLYEQKKDSAVWAFKEGKKRGGFSNYRLEVLKQTLMACNTDAILFVSGDMTFFPIYYLQTVENFRKDISIIDSSLLNTAWYPLFLKKNQNVVFDIPDNQLDSLDFIKREEEPIKINRLTWTPKTTYKGYLLRGERLLLSILKQNNFNKAVYFSKGFDNSSRLGLENHSTENALVDKLEATNNQTQDFNDYLTQISNVLELTQYINLNSVDQHSYLELYRFNILYKINTLIIDKENKKAETLMAILNKYATIESIPFLYTRYNEMYNAVSKKLKAQ